MIFWQTCVKGQVLLIVVGGRLRLGQSAVYNSSDTTGYLLSQNRVELKVKVVWVST